ncbi:hypothetical protein T069G_07289 [Trichoderma breve]|uniref:3-carboxymuconate cyclase n=1 Tax=Trichoderma breve TaxID=2034170 RepID=A0A9W9BAP2_9HYPO|nr:hypothetical protein T069G_07289 [Trichoderma breve]KAJ4859022.1 hypothetical protein T069G_07289 [Trichoderma breve]
MRSTLALATQLLTAMTASAAASSGQRVLYIQDNDPTGNSIVSIKVSQNGSLSGGVKTSTGGNGYPVLIVPSQDSVVVSGNYLFTVNSGSNTLSLFNINPWDPLHPKLIGKPAPTLGHVPVSVTYSEKLKTACVVNGGLDLAGVTCFSVDPKKGLQPLGPMRTILQTKDFTPPPAGTPPTILTGDIRFNPSSTGVFTTAANETGGPGVLYAYPVVSGSVSTTPVVTKFDNVVNPFSLNFLNSDSQLFMTNPHNESPGAALLTISPSLAVTETKIVTIPHQNASCWAAYAPIYDTIFVMDAAAAVVSTVDISKESVVSQFDFQSANFGPTDTLVDRNFLYFITEPFNDDFSAFLASPQVLVYDITSVSKGKNPQLIQSFDIFKAVGSFPDIMGLAIYAPQDE